MRSLSVDIGSGSRCELYYWTDYRGKPSKDDAETFMRAALFDLASIRGDSSARRDALSFIQSHRLGMATDDIANVLKNAVRSGKVVAVVEPRRLSGAASRGSDHPKPRAITFTPSQLLKGATRMTGSIGAAPPAWPRLSAENGIAIWF